MSAIVLDIDETLLHSFEDEDDVKELYILKTSNDPYLLSQRNRLYFINREDVYGNQFSISGILRPGYEEFLDYCNKTFDKVIIWSAGQRRYVNSMVDIMFANIDKPYAIWTFNDIEKHKKGYYYKPLKKMEDKLALDLSRTLVVDNQSETFSANIENAIHIPHYEPKANLKGLKMKDDALFKLMKWIEANKDNKDFTKLDKRRIFK